MHIRQSMTLADSDTGSPDALDVDVSIYPDAVQLVTYSDGPDSFQVFLECQDGRPTLVVSSPTVEESKVIDLRTGEIVQ